MKPFSGNEVAVQWEFRCQSKERPDTPWDWRCCSREGAVVASSKNHFRSLRAAVHDASQNGFSFDLPHKDG
jgi:hypothetical protein